MTPAVYLSVCWFVSSIKQKLTSVFGWIFSGKVRLGRDGKIFVVMSVWIHERIEGFFTIARQGIPNMVRTQRKRIT